jgi:LysR family transcriptional regulator, low CO2-responsive transcriptional regulator
MEGPDRDFTLGQLRTFVCAARARSFSRAADQLGISQPAVSDRIAMLEERLGQSLFLRRNGTTPLLTAEGVKLLDKAEGLLSASRDMRRDEAGVRKQRVRLSIGPHLREVYLKPLLPRFYREHPGIDLELLPVVSGAEAQSALDKGKIDLIAYTVGRGVGETLSARYVCDVPTVMVGPPGIRGQIASGATSLADIQFILSKPAGFFTPWIEQHLAESGFTLSRPILNLEFPDVIQQMVEDGQGASILMFEQVAQSVAAGRLEIFGPALPVMQRIIARSERAPDAAGVVEAYLIEAFQRS